MFSFQWYNALYCYMAIWFIAIIVMPKFFGVNLRTVIFSCLLVNCLPITIVPGFSTPVFLQDLLIIFFLIYMFFNQRKKPLGGISLISFFVWPLVCVIVALLFKHYLAYGWVTYIYRSLGFWVYFSIGSGNYFPKIEVKKMLNCYIFIWTFMSFFGFLQYSGIINLDFYMTESEVISIQEGIGAQRGFMGLNRGALGLWAGAAVAYSYTQLLLDKGALSRDKLLYILCLCFSLVVVLYSGSRTGIIICILSILYPSFKSLNKVSLGFAMSRIIIILIISMVVFLTVKPVRDIVLHRVSAAIISGEDDSLSHRQVMQRMTINYVFSDFKAFICGMGGGGEAEYVRAFNYLSHPHSQYMQILWDQGVLGLLFYLILLWRIFTNMSLTGFGGINIVSYCGRAIFITGLIGGLAVGNFTITTFRLATYGYLMCYVYGAVIAYAANRDYEYLYNEIESDYEDYQ